MSRGVEVCSIILLEGTIAGCSGFQHLIDGEEGERQWSLSDWAAVSSDGDDDLGGALTQVGRSLCGAAIKIEADGDWMVNFIATDDPPQNHAMIPEDLSASLQAAITAAVTDADVRAWIAGATETEVQVWRPADSPSEHWGLSAEGHRLLDACEANGTVGSLYVEIGIDGWSTFGVLWRLGFLSVSSTDEVVATVGSAPTEPVKASAPAVAASPPTLEQQPAPSKSAPKQSTPPSTMHTSPSPTSERQRPSNSEQQRNKRDDSKPKRKRKTDPRRTILLRSPSESPPDKMEDHLKEAYDILIKVTPEYIFRLRKTEDLDMRNVDQRYHKAASRYHPDRYRNASQGVKSLAEGCFTAVADSFHKLKDTDYLEKLKNRLIEKETGKKVVTEKTRAKSKVDHAKAEVLFRQKRYEDGHRYAKRAIDGDPDKWQYKFLMLRCAYRGGMMTLTEVEPELLGLQGMTTVEKAEHLYILGEMFLRTKDETRAYKLFDQALSLDGRNVGASRRLRLRDRRNREDENKSSGGLFGGLFRGRKE